jgi:hypothetical protein
MYCSRCGQPVSAQSNCPNCGAPAASTAPIAGVPAAPGFPVPAGFPAARVAGHLRTLGILWIVFSIYLLLQWLLVLPFLHAFMGSSGAWMAGPNTWVYPLHPGGWLLHVIAIAVIVRVILSLAAGVALLTRQPWGRIFAIVIAFLTLLKPLLGTVLAIYTLWVLLSRNAGPEYDRIVLSNQVPPPL